eukprot:m.144974 g.144974  ORF g.144974 m.144974 type:complete len:865 (-) comp30404_c0_seq3:55-2649(-)
MPQHSVHMVLFVVCVCTCVAAVVSGEPTYLGLTRADLNFWDRATSSGTCDHLTDCCHGDRSCANQPACIAKGCCWDAHGPVNWCSGAPAPSCNTTQECLGHGQCDNQKQCACDHGWEGEHCEFPVVTMVHVVQSCHLDVGFDGSIKQVLSEYFTRYIPSAIATAKEMRNNSQLPLGWRSNFMLQSYYVSLYLDCPPNIGLPCPTPEEVAALKSAAKAGDVHWHAFPHNAELEMGTPTMLAAGINATHLIDAALGLPPKRVLSQRDVPGISRAAIPILKKAGVHAVSVGVNTASMYPRVPKIFRWSDPASNEEIYAMWHGRGYGGYTVNEAVRVPGLSHVLVTDWNGDNQGPSSSKVLVTLFQHISQEFPNASVFVSTFDNFTSLLDEYKENLPVLSQEIGDTWIYGTPSDPIKQATMRATMRAWAAFDKSGGLQDDVYLNATRLLVKCIEHTWGDHVELENWQQATSWENQQFEKDRHSDATANQTFQFLESTWWEQRLFSTDVAADTLSAANHPLWTQFLQPELAALNQPVAVPNPAAESFTHFYPSSPIKVGDITLGFDKTSGAVSQLIDSNNNTWASATNPLFGVNYQTYNITQFQAFQRAYSNLTNPPSYFPHDFGKPNDTQAMYNNDNASAVAFWQKTSNGTTTFLIESTFSNQDLHVEYGAPSTIWTQISVPPGGSKSNSNEGIDVTILLINKTATRHAEAMFLQLNPLQDTMEMDKLGTWIELGAGLVVDGGNKHMHGVNSGVRFNQSVAATKATNSPNNLARPRNHQSNTQSVVGRTGSMLLETLDAGVVVFGEPSGFPTIGLYGNDEPNLRCGASSMLLNNLWGTNYVMWYPFEKDGAAVPAMENIRFRYRLKFN